MNSISTTHTIYYYRASRTIETILASNGSVSREFYMYNYEGNSFSLFETKKDVSNFFNSNIKSKVHFKNEQDLDNFLIHMNLS